MGSSNVRATRTPEGDIAIKGLPLDRITDAIDGDCLVIQREDVDDLIAALQALRGDVALPDGLAWCKGCRAIAVPGWLDRCEACRARAVDLAQRERYARVAAGPEVVARAMRDPDIVRKIEETNERMITFLKERLPPRPSCPPPDYTTIKKSADSSGFVYAIAGRRPIERYVRAQVAIPGSKGRIDGTIEIGLHRDIAEPPHAFRDKLIEVGEVAVRVLAGRPLDEDAADEVTEDLDRRIVGLWGDRPRFIEIWRGTGDDAEPLSQLYAPHGMPIQRPRPEVLRQLHSLLGPLSDDPVQRALHRLLDELGGTP